MLRSTLSQRTSRSPLTLKTFDLQVSGLYYGILYNLMEPEIVKTKKQEMHQLLQLMEEQLQDKYFSGRFSWHSI